MARPGSRLLLFAPIATLLLACTAPSGPSKALHPVYVERVSIDRRTDTPVLMLKEQDGEQRDLPIWIGMSEAQSIAMAMEEMEPPRPNTHDLIKNLIDELNGQIVRVVITELRGHTYYAVINLRVDGEEFSVDSRPSDAIAVAIRTGAPLFASDAVLVPPLLDEDYEPALEIDWHAPPHAFEPGVSRTH